MSVQPFFNPNNKNDKTMNIYTKSISVDSFNADNFNPTTINATTINATNTHTDLIDSDVGTIDVLESDIIISKDYKHKDVNHTLYPNLNISYNTANNLFYVYQPQPAGGTWSLQDTNNPTILPVPNEDIIPGSRFRLKMGLQVNDLNAGSGNIISFSIRIGNSGTTGTLFESNPPKNQLPIHIEIDSELTCVSKSTSVPFEYGFVIVSKYTETMNNQQDTRTLVRSSNFTGLGYVSNQSSFIDYQSSINITNANTIYNRGVYNLYKIN